MSMSIVIGLVRALQAILKIQKCKGIYKNNLDLYINIHGLPIHIQRLKEIFVVNFLFRVNSKSVYLIGAYFGECLLW